LDQRDLGNRLLVHFRFENDVVSFATALGLVERHVGVLNDLAVTRARLVQTTIAVLARCSIEAPAIEYGSTSAVRSRLATPSASPGTVSPSAK
jgi:hypothetical protein